MESPKRFLDQYRNIEDLTDSDFVKGELKKKPIDYSRHRYGYGKGLLDIYDTLGNNEQMHFRKSLREEYYGSLGFVDEQIGKIIDRLKTKNLLENTIIIFTSDHGSAFFDNQMLHKGAPFPTQLLVPMVVWTPNHMKLGKREGFTSHVDIYPSLMQLAGVEKPKVTEGKSFVDMFDVKGANTNDFVVIESALVTSLMNDDWLIGFHYISKQVDLYNLENDSMCHDKVANDSKNQRIIEELQQKLVHWRRSQNPKIEIGDDPLYWSSEVLGKEAEIEKLKKSYLKAYRELTKINDDRPGITGEYTLKMLAKMDWVTKSRENVNH